ncbi:MAG: hypothetical protein N3E40_01935 [Dehalococcoidia bacterium]|nr:hypothetical protein [Dehalococcoidia bacterium]
MRLDWKELEPGVWGASTPEGLDFIIEEATNGATGETLYQASQVLRTCSSAYENRIRRFPSLEEAKTFLEDLAAIQLGLKKDQF